MAVAGPNFPSVGANDASTGGTVAWSNLGNINSEDGSVATASPLSVNFGPSEYLKMTGFGFAIPAGSTIEGFLVEIKASCASGSLAQESSIKIVKSGSVTGNEKSTGTTLSTGLVWRSYGSSSDLWGPSWVASDINSSGFGIAVSYIENVKGSFSDTVSVDTARITVTYIPPPMGGNIPTVALRNAVYRGMYR